MILIDAEKIIWEINEIHKNHGLKDNEQMIFDETDVIGLIVTAPTIDAVPVVRCKDCRDYKPNPYSEGNEKLCMCWADWIPTEPDDFCSYGERSNNETD